ncbi:APC family permease [Amycolatopsis sp. cmx-11-32]|uniref:APC family permease n=1 Tax=Amycolatopsis sp. cmx-11-32 TaxID=2785796 RepID=UPI0039E575F3
MSSPPQPGLERKIGPLQATAINMTQMCGIGPFVTIPAMVATLGGPQAVFGWLIGAIIALADGLIWAELGAALPGAGGTYVYLREAFGSRTGRLMPFLFAWSAVLFIPLIMSTGIIGLVQYLGYLIPGVADEGGTTGLGKVIGLGVIVLVVLAAFRRIGEIGKLTTVLFAIMLFAALSVIVAPFTRFDGAQAFAFTPGAFSFGGGAFWAGLGAGLIIAIYDYLGYNTSAYLGGEVRDPGRTLPRSIIFSILGITSLYFLLQLGVLGSIPLEELKSATSVASTVLEQAWGTGAAKVITVFIVIAAIGSLFTLTAVINAAVTVLVLVQSLAQVAAIVVLRRRRPELDRPYRQWLYPIPTIIALLGWVYIYFSATWLSIGLSVGWIALGVAAFLTYAKAERVWPFGPKGIQESFAGAAEGNGK